MPSAHSVKASSPMAAVADPITAAADAVAAVVAEGIVFCALAAAAPGTPAAAPVVLPPCDATRRLLATEYARLHWKLRTSSRRDASEGWWQLRVEQTKGMRPPRPLLSEVARAGSAQASKDGHLLPALDLRPRLCFSGAQGAGDEVYDAVGPEGLLAVRPGQKAGEVFAFFDREAAAEKAFRRLTGQPPGQDAVPVTAGGAAAGGLRVLLAQTMSGRGAPRAQPARAAGPAAAEARGDGCNAQPTAGPGAARAAAAAAAEPVLDSWEDASDE
ncbi:unnamed protein product [Prorocentrum cordatum]|uniref:Uncharacterized protein n=1 Tax=Prorocentrum cordatum TaxID=2364126 RepID=A0ABN9U190_9DINO|nr:unnamed protein product [Polarella glacialis]